MSRTAFDVKLSRHEVKHSLHWSCQRFFTSEEPEVTLEERHAWIRLVVSVVVYGVYVAVLLGQAEGRTLVEVEYAAALLWTIGGGIAGTILMEIVVAAVRPGSLVTDERDREIGRFGSHTGQAFVAIGALAGMLMAVAGWDRFWIANVIYLCFILSAVLESVAKIFLYRAGVPRW